MAKNGITLAQANQITQARYNFSVIEKRAVYLIIKEVRKQFVDNDDGQRDLFDDLVIRMSTNDLQESDTVLRHVYEALRNLRRKSIWIEDDNRVLELGYINYFEHEKRETSLEVQVSHKILPYLVELAREFTTYSLTVAISLKTKYSQRLYELCSQYKKTGFRYITKEFLIEKFMLPKSYQAKPSHIKTYVLNPAVKEIKKLYDAGQCDLYFSYKTDPPNSRNVKGYKLFVYSKENETEKHIEVDDKIYFIKQWLNSWFYTAKKPKNAAWVDDVVKRLVLKPENIGKLYKRLIKMQEDQAATSYAALARHIIEEDFVD